MKPGNTTTLAYHQRFPEEIREEILRTLLCVRTWEDNLVEELWDEDKLKELLEEHKGFQHWKLLENKVKKIDGVPSRIWRGVLEQVGRTLLAQAERMELFCFLKKHNHGRERVVVGTLQRERKAIRKSQLHLLAERLRGCLSGKRRQVPRYLLRPYQMSHV